MLIRFVVSNFLSFDEETEFNMLAGNFKQHKEHVYKVGKLKVLKAAAIYGANAAGKSNLIKAIDTLKDIVKIGELLPLMEKKKFKLNPLNQQKPIQFEIEFSIKNKVYAYGLSINKNKIIEEWLYESEIDKDDKIIFERKLNKKGKIHIQLGKKQLSAKEKLLVELLEDNLIKDNELLLGKYDILKIREITISRNWIEDKLIIIYPYDQPSTLLNSFIVEDEDKRKVENIIKLLGLGIENIQKELINADKYFGKNYDQQHFEDLIEGEDRGVIHNDEKLLHILKIDNELYVEKILFLHNYIGGKAIFEFEEQSTGTQRIIDFIPLFLILTLRDTVIVIDEIDQSIHVNLLYAFLKKNMANNEIIGQLIFTTHESNLLDLKIFRQDEIWFAEKDRQKGSTQLYSLSEFNPRYDLDIRKGYLQGRFGAIPFLADLEKLDWSNLEIKQENQEQNKD